VDNAAKEPSRLLSRVILVGTNESIGFAGDGSSGMYIWGGCLTKGEFCSFIDGSTTRAADIIGKTPGVLYSNVPITEPLYVPGTYALGAKVRDASHTVYESQVEGNTAALDVPGKWLKLGATNQRAMLDEYNNTQTQHPEEIILVVSPQAIAQGLYLGNLDASEVRVSMVDQSKGVVYSETHSLIVSTSASSFYRWCFNRIRRKTYFLTLKLPVFANALVTIAIRKPGGIAKCGMYMIGPAVDVGLSLMGLSTEIKDYSTTTFNVDGTSSTIPRGYSKRMSVDISIDNEQIDSIEEQLINYRQKVVVWVGAVMYGSAMVCGKYSSFKKVIESYPRSKMALQIEGVV